MAGEIRWTLKVYWTISRDLYVCVASRLRGSEVATMYLHKREIIALVGCKPSAVERHALLEWTVKGGE